MFQTQKWGRQIVGNRLATEPVMLKVCNVSLALTSGWYYICILYCTPNTNGLSRKPDWKVGVEKNNNN